MPSKKFDWTQIVPLGVVLAVAGFLTVQLFEIRKDFSEARIADAERYHELSGLLALQDFKINAMKSKITKLEKENDDEQISDIPLFDNSDSSRIESVVFFTSNERVGGFSGYNDDH